MSFVTALRDYVEFVNNIYDSVSGNLNFFQLGQHTLSYLFQTVLYVFSYIFTFQWLQDLSNLPIIVPQLSLTVLKENLVLENPSSGIFSFFQTSFFDDFETNKFIIGFLNSFFLSLPISCSNLIIFRRLLVQGIPAGISAALGSIFGHFLFLGTIFFGIRFFLIPWLSFDSVQYLLGLFLILASVYSMSHEVQLTRVKSSSTLVLLKMFALNFALAWTEQSCVFQYIGNLTFSGEPTILETLSARNQIDSFLIHISYLLGILVGSLFFSFLFCFLVYRFTFFIIKVTGSLYSESIEKINFILITTIIGLSLASIPFYGLDYLITKPLGFVSQDKILEKSIFYTWEIPKPLIDIGNQADQLNEPDVDVAPLDRARYLESYNNTFEDLNYQGEYAWKTRDDRRKLLGKDSSTDFLLKWLKKPEKKLISSETQNIEKVDSQENRIDEGLSNHEEYILFNQGADNTFLYPGNFPDNAPNPVLESDIKKKYYSNPVYKNLLSTDIDFFLLRQPSSHSLTPSDEKNLFDKRLMLADYYDSLRFYKELPYAEDFQNTFQGSKSYADRIYNQQFKGTFNIVRRLFSITGNDSENLSNNRVLKYDQPLYTNQGKKNQLLPLFHEEIVQSKRAKTSSLSNEKLDGSSARETKEKPFFETTQAKPFYAGWDNEERKFIITNRFLPRSIAGFSLPQKSKSNSVNNLNSASLSKDTVAPKESHLKFIEFTAWPLSPQLVEIGKKSGDKVSSVKNIPYTFLFQLKDDNVLRVQEYLGESGGNHSSSLPTNILLQEPNVSLPPTSLFDIVAPKRGGFIWPGGSELKINLSQLKK